MQKNIFFKVKGMGQTIYTSMKNGTIEIVYQAIPIDCDGYPMIADNSPFREALELYITKKDTRYYLIQVRLEGMFIVLLVKIMPLL